MLIYRYYKHRLIRVLIEVFHIRWLSSQWDFRCKNRTNINKVIIKCISNILGSFSRRLFNFISVGKTSKLLFSWMTLFISFNVCLKSFLLPRIYYYNILFLWDVINDLVYFYTIYIFSRDLIDLLSSHCLYNLFLLLHEIINACVIQGLCFVFHFIFTVERGKHLL